MPGSTIGTIGTINIRGITCINTFPLELVFGKSYTILECLNCLTYATYKNVLVGMCSNCAKYEYNGKYGEGFINFPYCTENSIENGINTDNYGLCFGNINPSNIVHIEGLEYSQTALNHKDTYTIYNLSLLPQNELDLLTTTTYNIYSLNIIIVILKFYI